MMPPGRSEYLHVHFEAALVGVFGTVTQMALASCAFADGHARLGVSACFFALFIALFGAFAQRVMQAEA